MSSGNEEPNQLIPFEPVPLRPRHDGWHPEKQIAFVEALADSACVEEAARRVGMSVQSAYALRRRHDACHFREAWDAAIDMGMHRLEQAALSRALNGVARPVFYKGEQVGEWRHHDERLAMFLLRYRRPTRYGAWNDRMPPPLRPSQLPGLDSPELCPDDAALRLDGEIEGLCMTDWPDADEDAPERP